METVKYLIAVLLLLCWLPMPYEYYMNVRWGVMIAVIVLAFGDNEEKNFWKYVLYVFVGVLFNPIIIIDLPRLAWKIIDLFVAVLLIISLIIRRKEKINQQTS